jgi:hypothetical protein
LEPEGEVFCVILRADADYFNLAEKESRVATAHRDKDAPAIEQIRHVFSCMSAKTDIEKRDRALIAFTLFTGARDGAIASFILKQIDVTSGTIAQDAREVKTKRSKTFTPCFFPVGKDFRDIVADWVSLSTQSRPVHHPLLPKFAHFSAMKVRVQFDNRRGYALLRRGFPLTMTKGRRSIFAW